MLRTTALKCLGAVPVLVFALALTGCGGGSSGKTSVTGKVTQGGQPVAGSVTFIDSSNKEFGSPIAPDGKYQVFGLATGQAKILVKGATTTTPNTPAMKEAITVGGPSGGVAPNAKYAKADNGLTFDVKAGEQEYNIELK